jgi:tetratricopeptide (TPR) repeat protein
MPLRQDRKNWVQTSKRIVGFLAVTCLVLPAGAAARGIHYGAVTDPAILNCDQMHWRGETEQSRFCYAELLRSTTPAAAKAEAAWALSNLKQANDWFRVAMAESPDDHATKVRWGDLFAASHQNGEAMDIYREVLAEDPGNAFAMLGAAQVLVDRFEDAANSYLEPLMTGTVLGDGPLLGAWLLTARVSLENGNYDEAAAALLEADELLAQTDWPPLEVYALRASMDLLTDGDSSHWTELSLQYNPHFGGIYATPAHFYMITRRYRAAIDMYQKAVDIEPGLAAAHEELGINLLRDNQMTRARQHLDAQSIRCDSWIHTANFGLLTMCPIRTARFLSFSGSIRMNRQPLRPTPSNSRETVSTCSPNAMDSISASRLLSRCTLIMRTSRYVLPACQVLVSLARHLATS